MKTSKSVCSALALLTSVWTLYAQSGNPGQAAPNTTSDVISRITKLKGLKLASNSSSKPPISASCTQLVGIPCYSPQQIQNAYGVTSLLEGGFTGAGQTMIIIDSFGSPTIEEDLRTFDKGFGLPDPPSLLCLRHWAQ